MHKAQQKRFDSLYQQHLNALKRQGKSKATIDAYSRPVRRITAYFDRCPDRLTTNDLKDYFTRLVQSHSWSTVKLDRNGLQFFYKHIINKKWQWVDIVKPPQVKSLPDILTSDEITLIINSTREIRYQTYILTVYSMGLRLSEALNLKVGDIDAKRVRVHVRHGKGRKDRFVILPDRALVALRKYWATHRHPSLLFPGGKTPAQRHCSKGPMDRGGLQKSFKTIVQSCNIHKQVSIHSLRHCYGTHLVDEGLHLRAIQKEMGHDCPKTTALYTQLTEPAQQNAVDIINTMVNRLSITFIEEA
ncbi:MAG: tyrosine-type recombinase/integrase [Gammaproteobacteria bacterium]|nr:MAG: tyrosine-type recombinase/integrase [Gammaproteobacteria bacterium]